MADKSRTERHPISSDTVATVLKRVIAENGREHVRGYAMAIGCLAVVALTTAFTAWIMESVVNADAPGPNPDIRGVAIGRTARHILDGEVWVSTEFYQPTPADAETWEEAARPQLGAAVGAID